MGGRLFVLPQSTADVRHSRVVIGEHFHIFWDHENGFVLDQLKVAKSLLRHFDVNRITPLSNRLYLDQRAGGVDVLDAGTEMTSSIGRAINVQQVWPNINYMPGCSLMNVGLVTFEPTMEKIDVAKKVVNEWGRGKVVNLFRRSDLLDAALVHHHDAVSHLECLFLIVGDEDAGDMDLIMQLPQPSPQLQPDFGIESAKRFVEQQDAWFDS